MLIKEVNVNRSGSLVLWSTVSMKAFDHISRGQGFAEDSVLISGFSITTNGHTAATNTGGSVITLVLRMLVQPLQEKRQQAIESITLAINQTVERLKEALEKHQPPSFGGMYTHCVFVTSVEGFYLYKYAYKPYGLIIWRESIIPCLFS